MRKALIIFFLLPYILYPNSDNSGEYKTSFRLLLTPTAYLPEKTYLSSTDIAGLSFGCKLSDKISMAIITVPLLSFSFGFKYQLYNNRNLNISTGSGFWYSMEEVDFDDMKGKLLIFSQQLITTFGNNRKSLNFSIGINPYKEDGEKSYFPINLNFGGYLSFTDHIQLIIDTSLIKMLKSKGNFRFHDVLAGGLRFSWEKSSLDLAICKYDSEIAWENNIIIPIITYTRYFK